MDYADYIGRQTDISVSDAIEILTPIFLRAIQWNPYDDLSKIRAEKMQFIEDTIIQFSKNINGNLIYDDQEDDYGNPIDWLPPKLSKIRSTVDCKQLLNLFHFNFNKDYIVPPELEEMLNIKTSDPLPDADPNSNDKGPTVAIELQSNAAVPSDDNHETNDSTDHKADNSGLMIMCAIEIGAYCNTNLTEDHTPTVDEVHNHLVKVLGKKIIDKSQVNALLGSVVELMIKKHKRQEMVELAKLGHKPLNDAKDRIRAFIRIELSREDGQAKCTCKHSQITRYVLRQVAKNPEACLEYGDNKKLSEETVKELVKEIIDPLRIQDTGAVLKKCEIHGMNN